jgi:adenylate cyclase
LHGEERVITVLFSDVRGFTTYSEGRTPREVFSLLNAYFSAIVPILEEHGGVIDKYIGDGIMVLFGAPTHQPDHGCRAVKAAVAMLRRVHELEPRWTELGAEQFKIGIGVHSGAAITGTVGSRHRLDYTAIGDTVNTSSRIESATKDVGAELLVSEATFDSISAEDRRQFKFSAEPSTISVKGKQKALKVYAVDVPSAKALVELSAS